MAKQIKAIKCPQCGSNQKTLIKEDYYKCDNCGTEYFLDNDDININISHKTAIPNKINIKPLICIVIAILVIIFIVKGCSAFFSSKTTNNSTQQVQVDNISNDERVTASQYFDFPITINNNAYIFVLSKRTYMSMKNMESREKYFYNFIDEDGNVQKSSEIENLKSLDNYEYRKFENNKDYLVINKRIVYEINKTSMSLDNVTNDIFSQDSTFQSGLASIEFTSKNRGNGFHIITNMGKEYYYYPTVSKKYTEDSYWSQSQNMDTLLPNASDSIYYVFTEKKTIKGVDYIPQLLKITYKYNAGGPEYKQDRPYWEEVFDPFPKRIPRLLLKKERYRITKFSDVTPDRLYFDPKVVYYDNTDLLIKFNANAAPDAPISLQRLNPLTGDIIWTMPIDSEGNNNHMYERSIRCKDKYVICYRYRKYLIVNVNNKKMKELTIKGDY